jgi:ABC-type transport system involved in cytochrome bd biosynthesis fused ATPase/permease subunit
MNCTGSLLIVRLPHSLLYHLPGHYIVQQGRIVERGTHETLLQQSGVYRRLYLAQFALEAEQISAGTPHERGSMP